MIFARANDESRVKSYRGKGKWESRRTLARSGERKATKMIPAWLTLDEAHKTFALKPEAVEIVRRIVEMACEGRGAPRIARTLNSEGVPPITPDRVKEGDNGEPITIPATWNGTYIYQIITGRTVLGECQPQQKVDGKRVPIGEPIPDYYPSIIDEATWFRAQTGVIGRQRVRGRVGTSINLSTSIIFDGHDGSPMHVHKRQGKATLVSSAALKRMPGAVWRGYLYEHFEGAFLRFVTDLKAEDLVVAPVHHDEAGEIAGQLQVVAYKIGLIQARMEGEEDIVRLMEMLVRLEAQRKTLTNRLEEIKRKRVTNEAETLGEAQGVVELLAQADEDVLPALRVRLQGRIRSLAKSIHVRVGDLDKARGCSTEVVFHDDTRWWFHASYGTTRKKSGESYEFGAARQPSNVWAVTLT